MYHFRENSKFLTEEKLQFISTGIMIYITNDMQELFAFKTKISF